MADSMYIAGAGMIARQFRQEALVDNFANVSTPGYKATRVFSKVLEDVEATRAGLQRVQAAQDTWIDFSQGTISHTGRDLDVALQGEGFFVVQTAEGERYTRNGNFTLDAEGTLVTAQGDPVMTDKGPFQLREGSLRFDDQGRILVDGREEGRLQIVRFADTSVLEREGQGRFAATGGARPAPAVDDIVVFPGCLEDSNATGIGETVRMLSILKQYEAAQRVMKMQSQVLGRATNELIR